MFTFEIGFNLGIGRKNRFLVVPGNGFHTLLGSAARHRRQPATRPYLIFLISSHTETDTNENDDRETQMNDFISDHRCATLDEGIHSRVEVIEIDFCNKVRKEMASFVASPQKFSS